MQNLESVWFNGILGDRQYERKLGGGGGGGVFGWGVKRDEKMVRLDNFFLGPTKFQPQYPITGIHKENKRGGGLMVIVIFLLFIFFPL